MALSVIVNQNAQTKIKILFIFFKANLHNGPLAKKYTLLHVNKIQKKFTRIYIHEVIWTCNCMMIGLWFSMFDKFYTQYAYIFKFE